jgi:molybdopterin/thiamine biosynthesis adenylyltransferase
MAVDILRHYSIFNADQLADKRIDVIGVGAVGSRLTLGLAKLGVRNIRVWDFDTVEGHNVANQVYGNQHVGQKKAEAISAIIKEYTGTAITSMADRVTGEEELGPVIFLVTDSMKSRKEIWEKAIKNKMTIDAMFEGRMGIDSARVYWARPIQPSHQVNYEKTLYEDGEAEVSPCGSTISVGPTAETLSAMLQWCFIRWFNSVMEGSEEPENELIMGLNPLGQMMNTWAA